MNPTQNLNIAQRIYSFLTGRLAERILISVSIIVFLTILFVVIIFIKATNQSKKASAEIEHAQEIIKQTNQMQRLVTEYESATKGFLISENKIYLGKREETDKELKAQAILLTSLFDKEIAAHKKRYQTLTTLIQNKNSFSDSLLKLHQVGQKDAALNLQNKSQDIDYASRIKSLTDEIEQDQSEIVSFSQKEKKLAVQMIYRQLFYFITLAFVLITLLIIWINIKYQQKARKANEYTNILTSNINDAVISTNLNWEILSWNEGAEKIYGWKKEEATGKVIYELLKTEYLHLTRDQVLQEVNKNGHVETEIIHTAKNGKKLHISFSKSGVTDNHGRLTRIITINKDITAFREMEAMLKQSNQQLEEKVAERTKELNKSNSLYQFISHVNQLIINTRNEQELFDGICEIAIKDGGFKMAWIGLIDENEMVNPAAIAGYHEGYLSFIKRITVKNTPEGRGPTGKALREGTYYVCQDNTTDPSVAPWLEEQLKRGFRSSIALPIKKFGKVVGGFTLYAPVSHFFDEHVIRLLTEAVHDIGHCLEFIETEKQRKENELLLKEKEAITESFFNTTPDGIILGSPEGAHYYANRSAAKLLGYTQEEMLQVNRNILIDQSDPKLNQYLATLFKNNWARGELIFLHKDGTKIPCMVSTSMYTVPDGKEYASVIFQDIREQIKSEKLINDYRYAIDQSSLVDISNKEGLITYVNENFCKITKYSPEELLGKNQRILNSGYHPKKMFTELWRTILKGEVWRGEVRDKAKDGSIFWVQTTIVPFKNSNGEIEQFLSIRKDITAGKEAEELIQIANERYEIINSATRDIIWEKDFIHNKTVYNNGITTMLGYNLKEIDDINTWWEQNVHPEDFERIAKNLNDVIKRQQKFVVEDYRLRCADGSYKYISDRVSVFYDEEGKLKRLIGIMQDVTEAKEGEKHLLKAIIEAQEKERLQLGMELHDNIKQILAATKLNLEMALLRIDKKELVTDVLSRSVGYITNSIQELRRLSHQLAPTFDEAFHLKDSITNMIINMDPEKQLKVTVHVDQQNEEIYNAFQTTIFRIVQEQFTNILKHAKATAVHISISLIESNICLNIKDNGIGFDSSVKKEGIGIENIRRRVQFFDGEFRLHTSAGAGCEIDIVLPLKTDQPVA